MVKPKEFKINWGVIDKTIQDFKGWEWVKQDILEIDGVIDRKGAKKIFSKLQEKVNPLIHYDCYKSIIMGGSIIKIAKFPIYIPPKPKNKSEYLNSHIKNPLEQKWIRPLPILQNRFQTEPPTPHEWSDAINNLNIAYAKWITTKDIVELESLKSWRKIIQREWDRIKNGVWVMIKGVPIYFCGSYYFFLTYWSNKESSANDYIEADLHEFLHAEAVIKTRGIKGRIEFCRRQDGKSTRHFCLVYWADLITQLKALIQGKSETDTQDDFGEHYSPKMATLPFIFRPHKESELRLVLGLKNNLWKDSKLDQLVKTNVLSIAFQGSIIKAKGGEIVGLKPNSNAGDGKTTIMSYTDEFGKMLLVDIVARYDVLVPASSKVFMTTTVEKITPKVMPQCIELSEASDYSEADTRIRGICDSKEWATTTLIDYCYSKIDDFYEFIESNKKYEPIFSDLQGKITIKGMVQYVKPAWYCLVLRDDNINFIDNWGQSKSEKGYHFLNKERKKLYEFGKSTGNMAAYRAHLQKYAFDLEEALGDDSIDNLFDIQAINAQIKRLENARAYGKNYIEIPESEYYMAELEGDTHTSFAKERIAGIEKLTGMVRVPLYEKYRLEWSDGLFSPVVFVPDKNGVHEIAEFPDILNNVRWEGGVNTGLNNREDGYTPKNIDHTGGIDSVDLPTDDLTGKSKPSDFCLIIKASKRCNRITNNRPVYRLKFRPRDPEEAYMEALKALWLFGCSSGFENGKEAFKTWAKKINCIKFISLAVTIDTTQIANKKQLYFRGNTNTNKDKEINFLNLSHYVTYYILRITDIALLKALKGLTYKNLTKRDDCAAAMQAETTDKNPSKLSVALGNRQKNEPMNFWASFKSRL